MVVGVVPAAGRAARLQPLKGSKEVIEIHGRPVLASLVEQMWAAPADEVRVVTLPEKTDVAEASRRLGATVVYARPPHSVCASLLAGMEGLADDDIVLFGFPDTLWEPPDGFARLLRVVLAGEDLVLGLFEGAELERSDVAVLDGRGRVAAIDVKPSEPRSAWIWGCAAGRASVLSEARRESEPGMFFDHLARDRTIAAVKLSDTFIDIGTRETLASLLAVGNQ